VAPADRRNVTLIDQGSDEPTSDTLELIRLPVRGSVALDVGSPEGTVTVELPRGRPLVIGSSRAADVRVQDRAVSARHCEVRAEERGVEVVDLGSTNGVYVGAARLPSAVLIEDGASFVIGSTSITARSLTACEPARVPAAPGMIGDSPAMRRVVEALTRHARSRASVLFQGESGTGKDVAARALHRLSGRRGRYVPLNVGAFPDALADAAQFGHRRGAYTGAVTNRTGAFELAHGGTLFLDEIAELSAATQVRLLRVVEDGCVRPLGASQPVEVDSRIASASWAKLEDRVADGRFRVDLFHRLATVTISLPPLRQRKSDIPALARELLSRLASEVGPKRLTGPALARLTAHSFPGNVRELSAILYRAAMSAPTEDILSDHLELADAPRGRVVRARSRPEEALELLERHGNISAAARAAGVPRSTFRAWLSRERQKLPTTFSVPAPGAKVGTTQSDGAFAVLPSDGASEAVTR
jgi:transcriptional regulator with PAS, ATPase and Fis domain